MSLYKVVIKVVFVIIVDNHVFVFIAIFLVIFKFMIAQSDNVHFIAQYATYSTKPTYKLCALLTSITNQLQCTAKFSIVLCQPVHKVFLNNFVLCLTRFMTMYVLPFGLLTR
uniref:Uncharacterized protein n=1 Tax=Lygus hesperus TaxID=30085 RepID=A0A146KLH0_LYGHE